VSAARFASLVPCVSAFDASAFALGPSETAALDPSQKLLLRLAAGLLPSGRGDGARGGGLPAALGSVGDPSTGVFVGVSYQEHAALMASCGGRTTTYTATGSSLSVNAGRVSYVFGLRGPSLAVDTACSSSLVALASSRSYLHARQCDRALVGGCNVLLTPAAMNMYAVAGMLAPGGRCRVMDASAEGYVRAEAAVMLHVAHQRRPDGVDLAGGTTGAVILSGARCAPPPRRRPGRPAPPGAACPAPPPAALPRR